MSSRSIAPVSGARDERASVREIHRGPVSVRRHWVVVHRSARVEALRGARIAERSAAARERHLALMRGRGGKCA